MTRDPKMQTHGVHGPAPGSNGIYSNALLTAEQAGELLNVPASWVLQEARADRIPHIRFNRKVRFEADQLEAWWQTRRRGPRPRMGSHPVSESRGMAA